MGDMRAVKAFGRRASRAFAAESGLLHGVMFDSPVDICRHDVFMSLTARLCFFFLRGALAIAAQAVTKLVQSSAQRVQRIYYAAMKKIVHRRLRASAQHGNLGLCQPVRLEFGYQFVPCHRGDYIAC